MTRRFAAALLLMMAGATGVPRVSFGANIPSPGWRSFGLQGLTVRSLAAAPDLICAGTNSNGVFCRDLASSVATWRSLGLSGSPVSWLWIDPVRPDFIFAATGSQGGAQPLLFRTLDGGTSWQRADTGLTGAINAVQGVPGSPTLYVQGSAVWRSDDLGSSWRQVFGPGTAGVSLEVAPTDPNTVWAGGETVIFAGYTVRSRDGGTTWDQVWDSYHGPGALGDNQTADISAHPLNDGLALTGHEGFVLRTTDHGGAFQEVLTAPARFFLDWDRGNLSRAYAGGSPNGGGALAFVSRDHGRAWSDVTGILAPRFVFDIEADATRLGVAFAATEDGVYRFYGGGVPLCIDTRGGIDALQLQPGPCPSVPPPGPAVAGDAIAGHLGAVRFVANRVDLGEVECLVDGADIALANIDPPEPLPGEALFILARVAGTADYGAASNGLPRRPSLGDCPP